MDIDLDHGLELDLGWHHQWKKVVEIVAHWWLGLDQLLKNLGLVLGLHQ